MPKSCAAHSGRVLMGDATCKCPPGTVTSGDGRNGPCRNCSEGQFSSGYSVQLECTSCPAGTTSPARAVGVDSCNKKLATGHLDKRADESGPVTGEAMEVQPAGSDDTTVGPDSAQETEQCSTVVDDGQLNQAVFVNRLKVVALLSVSTSWDHDETLYVYEAQGPLPTTKANVDPTGAAIAYYHTSDQAEGGGGEAPESSAKTPRELAPPAVDGSECSLRWSETSRGEPDNVFTWDGRTEVEGRV